MQAGEKNCRNYAQRESILYFTPPPKVLSLLLPSSAKWNNGLLPSSCYNATHFFFQSTLLNFWVACAREGTVITVRDMSNAVGVNKNLFKRWNVYLFRKKYQPKLTSIYIYQLRLFLELRGNIFHPTTFDGYRLSSQISTPITVISGGSMRNCPINSKIKIIWLPK